MKIRDDDTEPRLTEPVPTFASADEDAGAVLHVTPEAEAALTAPLSERFLAEVKRRVDLRFVLLLALVLLVHAGLIVALLLRDPSAPQPLTQVAETPVEVVVEPPPEQPPPPKPPEPPKPPKPPEPPRPKEDLSPAMSAPRAPNEDDVKTTTKEAKTAAPNKLARPSQGQPQAPAAAAPPPKDATTPPEKDETAKEEDTSKPDAEALDKARKAAKAAKEAKTKEAKAAPKRKPIPNALAALAGAPSLDATMSFAKPTPKTKIYGGTEDVRWMSEVEAMLEAKVQKLPHTEHYQAGGRVAICFHVDPTGRVIANDYCAKSGYPDIDKLAMRALFAAAPFPPPPPGLERGLIWVSTFDGQVPTLHFR